MHWPSLSPSRSAFSSLKGELWALGGLSIWPLAPRLAAYFPSGKAPCSTQEESKGRFDTLDDRQIQTASLECAFHGRQLHRS